MSKLNMTAFKKYYYFSPDGFELKCGTSGGSDIDRPHWVGLDFGQSEVKVSDLREHPVAIQKKEHIDLVVDEMKKLLKMF